MASRPVVDGLVEGRAGGRPVTATELIEDPGEGTLGEAHGPAARGPRRHRRVREELEERGDGRAGVLEALVGHADHAMAEPPVELRRGAGVGEAREEEVLGLHVGVDDAELAGGPEGVAPSAFSDGKEHTALEGTFRTPRRPRPGRPWARGRGP